MTVLVTGSSGFVGRAIMAHLAGHGAIGLDPVAAAKTHVIDDLSDRSRLRALIAREQITHIIHAGGVSGPMVLADICGVAGNAALSAFSQSLGCVSAKDGIRVIALSPGPVETDRIVTLMKKKAKDRTGDENNWQDLRKPLPFQRCATPEEIGAAAAFLASPLSGYTSGSVVTIDAGLSARASAF